VFEGGWENRTRFRAWHWIMGLGWEGQRGQVLDNVGVWGMYGL
jgi:hypothetical protein